MTQEFDGAGLTRLILAYGLAGSRPDQQTFLDSGNISQVLEISQVARRSLSPVQSFEGLFTAIHRNVHSGAGLLTSTQNPYAPSNPSGGFPSPVGLEFDIWLLGATTRVDVGANMTTAGLFMRTRGPSQGFSANDSGAAITPADESVPLFVWTDFTKISGLSTSEFGSESDGGPTFTATKIRWPRAASAVRLLSDASGACTINMVSLWGIFPSALGQDAWG